MVRPLTQQKLGGLAGLEQEGDGHAWAGKGGTTQAVNHGSGRGMTAGTEEQCRQ